MTHTEERLNQVKSWLWYQANDPVEASHSTFLSTISGENWIESYFDFSDNQERVIGQ